MSEFSDFIRNASAEEKAALFDEVMTNADMRQKLLILERAIITIHEHAAFDGGEYDPSCLRGQLLAHASSMTAE